MSQQQQPHPYQQQPQQQPQQPSRDQYPPSSGGAPPYIKLEHSPKPPQLQNYQSTGAVPNVLQPGGLTSRPPTLSSNTAPIVPTMKQEPPDYSKSHQTSTKPNSLSLSSHNYHPRSSPQVKYEEEHKAGYMPYTPTTPGGASGSSQYMSPTGSQRIPSNAPLGLADIRPRADSSLSDGLPGSSAYDIASAQSRTSNYMAPWALYAFDWCKWAPQGNSAGKLAIGSYLEDGHNYVSVKRNLLDRNVD